MRSMFCWKRSGPGRSPWIMKAPRITAVITSPGMPRASSGIIVAPATPLLPASEAATPSSSPLPKLAALGEVRLASE